MARVHSMVQQSAETVFCDSTAGLDRYNNPLFLLSTSTPAGGVPLGCVVTSGESESTVTAALKKLKEVLPSNAFYGRGDLGAKVILTDDSPPERNAPPYFLARGHTFAMYFSFSSEQVDLPVGCKKQNCQK